MNLKRGAWNLPKEVQLSPANELSQGFGIFKKPWSQKKALRKILKSSSLGEHFRFRFMTCCLLLNVDAIRLFAIPLMCFNAGFCWLTDFFPVLKRQWNLIACYLRKLQLPFFIQYHRLSLASRNCSPSTGIFFKQLKPELLTAERNGRRVR